MVGRKLSKPCRPPTDAGKLVIDLAFVRGLHPTTSRASEFYRARLGDHEANGERVDGVAAIAHFTSARTAMSTSGSAVRLKAAWLEERRAG